MAAKSDKPRFVVRTVRHGQVTIHGRAYAPSQRHMAYDGRLEELRFAFGRYPHDPHVVALWGLPRRLPGEPPHGLPGRPGPL
jgi:hypothetical protein